MLMMKSQSGHTPINVFSPAFVPNYSATNMTAIITTGSSAITTMAHRTDRCSSGECMANFSLLELDRQAFRALAHLTLEGTQFFRVAISG